jgi:mono/diheme cytochrome c family protein
MSGRARSKLGLVLTVVVIASATACATLCEQLGLGSDCSGLLSGIINGDQTGETVTGDADAGAARFATLCAECHGDAGTGNVGPDITGSTSAEIAAKLAEGGVHAGLPELTSQETDNLAAFLNR